MKVTPIFLFFLLFGEIAFAQLGGLSTYQFLELPYSARSVALGASMVPVDDGDIALGLKNPSLINKDMHHHATFSFNDYVSDIVYGNVAYARNIQDSWNAIFGVRYIDYGTFTEADESGNKTGTFQAGEYAITLGLSREYLEHFRFGIAAKYIYSSLADYYSSGLAFDLSGSYVSKNKLFTTSLLLANAGFQLKSYTPGNQEPLPINLQWGFSKKFEHMPLRLIVVAHHLNVFDFTYENPENKKTSIFENIDEEEDKVPFSEKLFRHFVFAGEFVLSKSFHVRFGYSHQRRKEMIVLGYKGFTGYTWGFGLRISKFHLSYGNAAYHLAGRSNHLSMSVNLSDFRKSND
jgi:hypothetical protein